MSAVYRYRNIPNEYIHLCKLVRHEYIEEGDLVTDILINVATTVEPNTDWLNNLLSNYDYQPIYIYIYLVGLSETTIKTISESWRPFLTGPT